jgi:hypothetical protein
MAKPSVKFKKVNPKSEKSDYYLIATDKKGKKIAFRVDSIK